MYHETTAGTWSLPVAEATIGEDSAGGNLSDETRDSAHNGGDMRCSALGRRLCICPVLLLATRLPETHSWQARLTANNRPVDLSFSPRKISSRQMSQSSTAPDEEDIIMLSGYPFYVKGPDPREIDVVAEKTRTVLEKACGGQLKSVDRMGSSAIEGISGTPVCDMLAELSPWPMTEDAKSRMTEAGYECKGSAPHASQDEWFFGGDGEPGHLGRVVLHTVPEGAEFVRDMKAFVEYINSHPDAFQRYNDVKVEGAVLMSRSSQEDGRLLGYKGKKADVCNEIKREAIEWWTKRNGKGE
eukprot:scaffold91682_cov72-Attheya_sp.AAC.1